MPIVAADLKFFGSANMPVDDSGTSGGAIDLLTLTEFAPVVADGAVGVVSDNAGDTSQSATITGRLASGAIDNEVLALNGTTRVPGSKVWERILSISLDSAGAGVITVDRNADSFVVKAIPIGVTLIHRTFYDSESEAGAVSRYEKIFIKNEHATLTLTNAIVTLTDDPSAKIFIGLATTKDDSASVANRKSAPGGVSFVDDDVAINVPTTNLAAGEAIGVWVRQNLGAGDAPFKSTYDVEISGTSA